VRVGCESMTWPIVLRQVLAILLLGVITSGLANRATRCVTRISDSTTHEGWTPSVAPAIDGTGNLVVFSSTHPVGEDDVSTDFSWRPAWPRWTEPPSFVATSRLFGREWMDWRRPHRLTP